MADLIGACVAERSAAVASAAAGVAGAGVLPPLGLCGALTGEAAPGAELPDAENDPAIAQRTGLLRRHVRGVLTTELSAECAVSSMSDRAVALRGLIAELTP